MSGAGGEEPRPEPCAEPPKRHWDATEPFWDFKASHWVEIFLTIALVFVGVSQLYVYWQQATTLDRQWRAMLEGNRINLLALTSVQRGIISVHTPVMVEGADPHNPGRSLYAVTFGWTNSGNTPPRNLVMKYKFVPSQTELIDPWESGKWRTLPPNPIAPHDTIGVGMYFMSQEDSDAYAKGQAFFYAMAEATYGDVFGSPDNYRTQFCASYHGRSGSLTPTEYQVDWKPCQNHNCSDEECKAAQAHNTSPPPPR